METETDGDFVMTVNFTQEAVSFAGVVAEDATPVLQSVPCDAPGLPPRSAAWWRLRS
jgi:hypothetical protein